MYTCIHIFCLFLCPSAPGPASDGAVSINMLWDHTNPPHPHHHPFNKFKLEFIKCNNSLNAHKTELSSLQFESFKFIKSDVWGWGGFVWPLMLNMW